MSNQLKISIGQFTDKGRKEINQDFHGASIPQEPQLSLKGVAIAVADGISSSQVSQVASESAVASFLLDYYCTSEAWSVKKSAKQVLMATNSWLYAQTQQSQHRYDKDRGYVCTFSALIIKAATAHIFHVGDTRVYQLHAGNLEQLTNDHRLWLSQEQSYLSRALGIDSHLEIDYHTLAVEKYDTFFLATDGVYEYVKHSFIVDALTTHADDLDAAARIIVAEAYEQGSTDNLTAQIVRVDDLPAGDSRAIQQQMIERPCPPIFEARQHVDGYKILREVHHSSRSHVYLAEDSETKEPVIIKTPSIDLRGDPDYLERFALEEWIARRINSPYVLKPHLQTKKCSYLYIATEYIDGQTLTQWMIDNPRPDIETVRDIVEQVSKGLRAFHRLEMLHQDIRPENIMIHKSGTVKIIDFGSTRVAGIEEIATSIDANALLGTAQYAAPEYFLGESGSTCSDLFSLGVMTYQMLTGRLPYGAQVAKAKTKTAQHRLRYRSVLNDEREIPAWIDTVIRKAVHPNPSKRYQELSEFVYDLRHPNKALLNRPGPPLMQRNPVVFWQCVSFILAVFVAILLIDAAT